MFTNNFKFKNFILSLIVSIFFLIPIISNSQFSQQWLYRYNGSGNSSDYTTRDNSSVDAAGNLYVAVSVFHSGSGNDINLMKFNSNGNVLWISPFPAGNAEFANALTLDNSGNIYVTGKVYNTNTGWDIITFKYTNSGTISWVKVYNSSSNNYDYGYSITVDGSGNVIVGGETNTGSQSDYLVLKYNSAGTLQWTRTYDGPSSNNDYDRINSITSDVSGNIYATGTAGWTSAGYDIVNLKFTPSGSFGATRYDGAAHNDDIGMKILVDQYGNYYVTGSSIESGSNPEIVTIKFSSANVPLWTKLYDNGTDVPADMKIDASGNVYVTGKSSGSGTGYDFITLKYNTSGTQLWAARLNGQNSSDDYPSALAVDGFGNVYVTGMFGMHNGDIATVKYNSSGAQIGNVAVYNGSANEVDQGLSIASNYNGSMVYVTGMTNPSTNSDIIVLGYSQLVGVNNTNSEIPSDFSLQQNYPNPFNPSTTIKFAVPSAGFVSIKVYDIAGKLVDDIVNEDLEAGNFEINYDGSKLSSGTYFYKMETKGFSQTKKMMLVK